MKTSEILKHYLGEITYGGNDGIITTFAVVSGFSGAVLLNGGHIQLSIGLVILFGLANLFADGLSMGIGNYLSKRAEKDAGQLDFTRREIIFTSIATFTSFLFFGFLPLVPYVIGIEETKQAFMLSIGTTIFALSSLGLLKGLVLKAGVIKSIVETTLVGGIAAVAAFVVGVLIKV